MHADENVSASGSITPFDGPVVLTVGKHTVVLKNPKFKTRTIQLMVKPGVSVVHNFRE